MTLKITIETLLINNKRNMEVIKKIKGIVLFFNRIMPKIFYRKINVEIVKTFQLLINI